MQDFYEKDPNKMNYKELATQAKFFKYTEEVKEEMCRIVDEIANDKVIKIAKKLLAEHIPINTIIKVTELSREKVLELAQQKSA